MTRNEAVTLLTSGDLLELGMEADRVRRRLHPDDTVTYALTAPAGLRIQHALRSAVLHGGTHVCLAAVTEAAALTPALLQEARAAEPSAAEIGFCDLPIDAATDPDAFRAFEHAGVQSVLLSYAGTHDDESLRAIIASARALGLTIRATLAIHSSDTPELRINRLLALRALSSEPIDALELQVHHASNPEARREEEATAADYLKTLAMTRILLPDVPHLQAAWTAQGPKVLELALRFGADDAGSVPWAQTGSAEPSHHGGESEIRRIIRDAGFRPVERDALFRVSLLH